MYKSNTRSVLVQEDSFVVGYKGRVERGSMLRHRDENAPVLVVMSEVSDQEQSEQEEDFALDPSDPRAHQRTPRHAENKRSSSPPTTPKTSSRSKDKKKLSKARKKAEAQAQAKEDAKSQVIDLSGSNESEEDEAFAPQQMVPEPETAKNADFKPQKQLSQWVMKRFLTSRKDRELNAVELPLETLDDFILTDFGTRFRGPTGHVEKINDDEQQQDEDDSTPPLSPRVGAPLYESPKRLFLSPVDDVRQETHPEGDDPEAADANSKDKAPVGRKRRENRYFVTDLATKCYNCGQIGHMSSVCVNDKVLRPCYYCARRGHNASSCPYAPCFNCLQTGHEARNCENARVVMNNCTGCGRSGHSIQNCKLVQSPARDVSCMVCVKTGHQHCVPFPAPVDRRVYCPRCSGSHAVENCDRSGSRQRNMQCYVCDGFGHIAAECPSRTKSASWRTNDYCFNCGEQGHYSTDCPERFSSRNRRSSNKRRRDANDEDYEDYQVYDGYAEDNRYSRGGGHRNRHTPSLNAALPTRPGHYNKSRRTNGGGGGGSGSRSSHSASPHRPSYRRR